MKPLVPILLHNAIRFFCLKLKIPITTELIKFSIYEKLLTGPMVVLGNLIFRFRYSDGFILFFCHFAPLPPKISITKPPDARGEAASYLDRHKHL